MRSWKCTQLLLRQHFPCMKYTKMMAVQKVSLAFGLLERTKRPLKVTFDAEIKHTNNVWNTTLVSYEQFVPTKVK